MVNPSLQLYILKDLRRIFAEGNTPVASPNAGRLRQMAFDLALLLELMKRTELVGYQSFRMLVLCGNQGIPTFKWL